MRHVTAVCGILSALLIMTGACADPARKGGLSAARKGFTTKLTQQTKDGTPAPEPPANEMRLVHYPSSVGSLAAYITPVPADGSKHPAIIWIFGGFSNGIDDTAWAPATPDNDQSARAFREAGIVTMYPSRRGGNDNPGYREGFYGEVDDIIAAAAYLAAQPGIDPKRIYLGGHSTGGTLALLVAESTDRFRAIFSFGPVSNVKVYGQDNLPFDVNDAKEVNLRAPRLWLDAIHRPAFVIEGEDKPGNFPLLQLMERVSHNPQIHFFGVPGLNHFSELAVTTKVAAKSIAADTGPTANIDFSL
jgi:Prolyl oligopeptidase family